MSMMASNDVSKAQQDQIKKKLGNMISPLMFGMAKLYLSRGGGQWTYSNCYGPVTLSIDRGIQSDPKPRVIQLFDNDKLTITFQQELYENMSYETPRDYFHTFEIANYIVGLCFIDDNQGRAFAQRVRSQIPQPSNEDDNNSGGGGLFKKKKMVVGLPTNFKHLQHIGFDPEKGFNVENIPEEWKTMFKAAGIRKKDLKDKETARVLYQTIQDHTGGTGSLPVRQQPPAPFGNNNNARPTPPVPLARPTPPVPGRPRATPPVPGRPRAGPPVPGPRAAPPIPGRPRAAPPVPAPRMAPPIPAARGVPAAPMAPPVAPMAPMAPMAPAAPIPRAAPTAVKTSSNSAPSRGNLLASIRAGKQLKKVSVNDRSTARVGSTGSNSATSPSNSAGGGGGLLGALAAAMAGRRAQMEQEEEDDDDWSD